MSKIETSTHRVLFSELEDYYCSFAGRRNLIVFNVTRFGGWLK